MEQKQKNITQKQKTKNHNIQSHLPLHLSLTELYTLHTSTNMHVCTHICMHTHTERDTHTHQAQTYNLAKVYEGMEDGAVF